MDIPNYDFNEDENTNFKQLYKYMPKSNFRMLICGNSGSGKTNLLYHILMKPLVYYDQIHLYGKNLEQEKYRHIVETMNDISSQVGYDIMHCNNDDIKPVGRQRGREAAWPCGQRVGLAIRRSRVRVPLWPFAGFVLGRPEFKFSTTLVNSQLVAFCQLGFLILLCCI